MPLSVSPGVPSLCDFLSPKVDVSENEVKARPGSESPRGASWAFLPVQENAGRWAGREQPKKEKSKEQVPSSAGSSVSMRACACPCDVLQDGVWVHLWKDIGIVQMWWALKLRVTCRSRWTKNCSNSLSMVSCRSGLQHAQ